MKGIQGGGKVRRMKEVDLMGFNSQIHRGKSQGDDSWVE